MRPDRILACVDWLAARTENELPSLVQCRLLADLSDEETVMVERELERRAEHFARLAERARLAARLARGRA